MLEYDRSLTTLVLHALRDGAATTRMLADHLDVDVQRLHAVLRRMYDRGMVTRHKMHGLGRRGRPQFVYMRAVPTSTRVDD